MKNEPRITNIQMFQEIVEMRKDLGATMRIVDSLLETLINNGGLRLEVIHQPSRKKRNDTTLSNKLQRG